MESLLAIGMGLVLRVVMDVATDNDDRVGGVLMGLWEGVVLNHFVRRMPGSFDPYLGLGFRIFVDFLFTQSLSRLALVALWSLVGMLLADISPNLWRDSGLRHLYRQVRRDVRHVKRAVPRIRVKNDLPSIRLFGKPRSASSGISSSTRSDRPLPARSRPASPAPALGPPRRLGRHPPGTLPDVSGWSETDTSVSYQRERVVTDPGPSPSLVSARASARYRTAHERVDATRVATSQTRITVQDATITQTQNESVVVNTTTTAAAVSTTHVSAREVSRHRVETVASATVEAPAVASTAHVPVNDPSCHDPPTIPDDWVDINRPPAQSNEPVAPFQSDPASTPESQPGPSTRVPSRPPSRPASVLGPPLTMDVLPDIPDADAASRTSRLPAKIALPESRATSVVGDVLEQPRPRSPLRGYSRPEIPDVDRASQLPEQIPLPQSRAASEIGGVYDEPRPRDSLRGRRGDKAASEIGVGPSRSLAPISTQTKPSRGWFPNPFAGSKLKQQVEVEVFNTSLTEVREETVEKRKSDVNAAAKGPEPQSTCTPAQVDPPASILSQPKDTTPLLLASEVSEAEQQDQGQASDVLSPANVNSTPTPVDGGNEEGSIESKKKTSLFNLPSPSGTPPPPFTEFPGDVEGPAAGEASVEPDPVTLDETSTVLTAEQSAAEEIRHTFLLDQIRDLEVQRTKYQKSLEEEENPTASPARSLASDIDDVENTLKAVKARINKKKFSDPPSDPGIPEVPLMGKTTTDAQYIITSEIMKMLLERDDAGPMTIQAVVNKTGKNLKKPLKEIKEAIIALVKLHKFKWKSESATPGVINITF